MKHRKLRVTVMALLVCFAFMTTAYAATHNLNAGDTFDLGDAANNVQDNDEIHLLGDATVTGDAGVNVYVTGEAGVTLTLDNATIDATDTGHAGVSLDGNSALVLQGTSTVTGDDYQAGVEVIWDLGQTLHIRDGEGDGTGTLHATGGVSGAGIGSGIINNAGTIHIEGGTLHASGGLGGAGIGGGIGGDGGTIIITGGVIAQAQGGDGQPGDGNTSAASGGGAGIGGGGGFGGYADQAGEFKNPAGYHGGESGDVYIAGTVTIAHNAIQGGAGGAGQLGNGSGGKGADIGSGGSGDDLVSIGGENGVDGVACDFSQPIPPPPPPSANTPADPPADPPADTPSDTQPPDGEPTGNLPAVTPPAGDKDFILRPSGELVPATQAAMPGETVISVPVDELGKPRFTTVTIAGSHVNLRLLPGLDAEVALITDAGETFEFVGFSGEWIALRLANGRVVWVRKDFAKVS